MDSARFEFLGVPEFVESVNVLVTKMAMATVAALEEGGHTVESYAKMLASGRPGPNVVTGTLRRSIHVVGPEGYGGLGISWRVRIGPSVIYGRRVELGFSGEDSLGRLYDQPGYPYMEPALDRVRTTLLPAIFQRAWASVIEG